MCRFCDNKEEHTLRDCEDAAVLIFGDAFVRAVLVDTISARQAVESYLDLT